MEFEFPAKSCVEKGAMVAKVSSRASHLVCKYLYPSPDEGQQIFREERGPKDAISKGVGGGWLVEVFQLTAALFWKLSVILLLTVF